MSKTVENTSIYKLKSGLSKKKLTMAIPLDMYKFMEQELQKHLNWTHLQDYILFLINKDLSDKGYTRKRAF